MNLVKYKINVSLNTIIGQKINEFEHNVVFCKNVGLMYVPRRCKLMTSYKLKVEVSMKKKSSNI